MLVLPRALLALAASSEHRRDILGLLSAQSEPSTATLTPVRTRTPPKPSTKTSVGPSASPPPSTSQYSIGQSTPALRTGSMTVSAILAATPSAPSQAADHSGKTWQVIGISIIAVLFIATAVTCALFFDRLWRFLKDVLCCTSRPLASEHFIPDCEKQNWDTGTLSSSPSDSVHYKARPLRVDTLRELPWNTDTQNSNTLHRQAS